MIEWEREDEPRFLAHTFFSKDRLGLVSGLKKKIAMEVQRKLKGKDTEKELFDWHIERVQK